MSLKKNRNYVGRLRYEVPGLLAMIQLRDEDSVLDYFVNHKSKILKRT